MWTFDRKEVDLKEKLGKNIECIKCRNVRISKEIDSLNAHYEGRKPPQTLGLCDFCVFGH